MKAPASAPDVPAAEAASGSRPPRTRITWRGVLAGAAILAALLFLAFPWLPKPLLWPARVLIAAGCAAAAGLAAGALISAARQPKRAAFAAILLVFYFLLLEGACMVAERILLSGNSGYDQNASLYLRPQHRATIEAFLSDRPKYTVFCPELGWTIAPSSSHSAGYRSNSQGLRSDRVYSEAAAPGGRLRVSCFGDSYTHGNEVSLEDSWPRLAEASAPGHEFLNFGVPGFGLDQAYLRHQGLGRAFDTDIVVIGIMPDNLERAVNLYRPFLRHDTGMPFTKPYAALDPATGEIETRELPLHRHPRRARRRRRRLARSAGLFRQSPLQPPGERDRGPVAGRALGRSLRRPRGNPRRPASLNSAEAAAGGRFQGSLPRAARRAAWNSWLAERTSVSCGEPNSRC